MCSEFGLEGMCCECTLKWVYGELGKVSVCGEHELPKVCSETSHSRVRGERPVNNS